MHRQTFQKSISLPSYSAATTGNSKTTSLPVRRRYTDENESNLYSTEVASFESRKLIGVFKIRITFNIRSTLTLSTAWSHQQQRGYACQQSRWGTQDLPKFSRERWSKCASGGVSASRGRYGWVCGAFVSGQQRRRDDQRTSSRARE